jgi:hypothetical protein
MNSGMASLSTVVKIGVSPSLLRRIQIRAKLQNNSSSTSLRKVACSGVFPGYRVHSHSIGFERRRTHSTRSAFPVRQTATPGGAGEVDGIRFLLGFIFGAGVPGRLSARHSHHGLLALPDVETCWPQ